MEAEHVKWAMFTARINYRTSVVQGESKQFTHLVDCGRANVMAIFKTEILIYQSKATVGEKFCLTTIIYQLDQEIKKKLVKGIFWE